MHLLLPLLTDGIRPNTHFVADGRSENGGEPKAGECWLSWDFA
ncbi:MAG: hypothetical protein ACLT4Y_07840 [Bifidobacterium breve]